MPTWVQHQMQNIRVSHVCTFTEHKALSKWQLTESRLFSPGRSAAGMGAHMSQGYHRTAACPRVSWRADLVSCLATIACLTGSQVNSMQVSRSAWIHTDSRENVRRITCDPGSAGTCCIGPAAQIRKSPQDQYILPNF